MFASSASYPDRPDTWPGGEEPEWAKDDDIWGFRKYSINGVLQSGDDPAGVEGDFDRQWAGQVVEDGGRMHYYPGSDRPASGTISGDDVLDYPRVSPAPSMADRLNAVTLSLSQSSYHDFEQHALSEIRDDSKRERIDEGLNLPQDLGDVAVDDKPRRSLCAGRHSAKASPRRARRFADAAPPASKTIPSNIWS